jgi:NADH-quinone oxidoreductase subunit M
MISPLLCLVVLPIAGAILIIAGTQARNTAVLASILNFLASLIIFGMCQPTGGYQFVSSYPVVPSLGIHFTLGADGLSVAVLLMSTAVTLAAICVARTPPENGNWFYASLLLISAGAIGAFASLDTFFFYMFHELALIPTFLLIGIWGSGDRQAAAWKVTTYLAFGSFVLLIGLLGLYLSLPESDRTFDMRRIAEWAPQAYASAPAPAAMLHAGVLKKFGLYGIFRLILPVFPPNVSQGLNTLLLVLVLGNILYVGYVTISQRKLDLMLGYASVMHMGYLFLGLLTWKTLGLAGAALMLVAHGLSIAALFALSGELRERTGTLDFAELGGLAKVMPTFGLLFGFATMAAVGLPGFANFAAELMIFFGAFSAGVPVKFGFNEFQIAAVIAVWGVVISAIFLLRSYRRIFMGPIGDKWKSLSDIGALPRLCIAGLIFLLVLTGFFPQIVLNYLTPALMWP